MYVRLIASLITVVYLCLTVTGCKRPADSEPTTGGTSARKADVESTAGQEHVATQPVPSLTPHATQAPAPVDSLNGLNRIPATLEEEADLLPEAIANYHARETEFDKLDAILDFDSFDSPEAAEAVRKLALAESVPLLKAELILTYADFEIPRETRIAFLQPFLAPDQPEIIREAALEAMERFSE